MNKIFRITSERRKGDDIEKREIVIENYSIATIIFIVAAVVLFFVFKDQILAALGELPKLFGLSPQPG